MKKVLVTGGSGFIGAHLVQKLLNNNYKVMVVDNLKTIGGIIYINPKSKFVKGDILDPKVLKKIENWKPKIIYHLQLNQHLRVLMKIQKMIFYLMVMVHFYLAIWQKNWY